MNLLTVLTIQANKTEVAVFQAKDNQKYAFELYSIIRERYRPHITSDFVYDNSDAARHDGQKILDAIIALNVDPERKELSNLLGDSAPVVQEIIDIADKKD